MRPARPEAGSPGTGSAPAANALERDDVDRLAEALAALLAAWWRRHERETAVTSKAKARKPEAADRGLDGSAASEETHDVLCSRTPST